MTCASAVQSWRSNTAASSAIVHGTTPPPLGSMPNVMLDGRAFEWYTRMVAAWNCGTVDLVWDFGVVVNVVHKLKLNSTPF